MPLTIEQISEVNATPFKQKLTGAQLQRFNDLILSDNTSPYQVVETMRQHSVSRDQLPALKSPGCEIKHIAVLQADHEKEWQEIHPQITATSNSAIAVLERFVSDWKVVEGAYGFTGPHIQDANDKIAEINNALVVGYGQQEDAEWQGTLGFYYNRGLDKIQAIISHITKWKANRVDTHVNDADKEVWENILNIDSKDLITALKKYLGAFDGNTFANGEHKTEAEETINSYSVWKTAKKKKDIFEVHKFISDFPTSLLVPVAEALLSELKYKELERMRELMDEYPVGDFLTLMNQNIFTEDELIEEDVATKHGIEILKNWDNIKENLPDFEELQAECKTSCAEDRTDIYLFGTPSTGKTCILTGLIGAVNDLSADFAQSAGKYAAALSIYLRNGHIPGTTVENFVATIQATTKENGSKHKINLVELAGEDFAENVANGSDGNLEFAQMGEGVPRLLANNNRKVFFLIVDPTSKTLRVKKSVIKKDKNGEPIYKKDDNGNFIKKVGKNDEYETEKEIRTFSIDQHTSLKTMINMLASSKNEAVMKKVEAIHIIVTKCDKFGEGKEREEAAKKLLMEQYGDLISDLRDLCKDNKPPINQHPDTNLNGVPRLFTFSLGKFYPGGYYQYDNTDARLLIKVISKCTVAVRPKTIWDHFCKFMNEPVV